MAYYRLNTSKLTVRECFRLGGVLAPVLILFKVLRLNLASKEVFASDIEDLIMLEDLQLEARCAEAPGVNPLRAEISDCGGELLFGYTVPPYPLKIFSLVYRASNCLIELIHNSADKPHTMVVALTPIQPLNEQITVLFPTKKSMDSKPRDDVQRLDSGSVRELLELHRTRPTKSAPLPVPRTDEEVLSYIVRRNQRSIENFVRRGIYIPVPEEEDYP